MTLFDSGFHLNLPLLTINTISASIIGGLILGRVFFRKIHLKNKFLWNYIIQGYAFFLALFFARGLDSADYPRLIGLCILYTIFVGFIALGNFKGGDKGYEE